MTTIEERTAMQRAISKAGSELLYQTTVAQNDAYHEGEWKKLAAELVEKGNTTSDKLLDVQA